MNVPDADAGVEDKSDNFGLYKTATGSYIADTADLAVGDYADEPTLLIKQTVSRGKTSTSLYDFKYTPTGAVAYAEGGGSVYYQDTKGKWFRDNFSDDGVFQATDSLTLSEVRNEEAVHDLDLDGDGVVGDTIESVLANDGQGKGIFKTTSGSYIVDDSTLSVGDQTNDPTILIKEVTSRGKTTTSLHNFRYDPSGVFQFKDGSGVGVYYARTTAVKQHGLNAMTLIMMEYFPKNGFVNFSEVLNDEAVYDLDLDGDGNIGDTISAVYMNVPDADAGVENPKDNFGLYKTATGSYIADTADLAVGDYADEPTLLIKQTVSRGKTSTSLI